MTVKIDNRFLSYDIYWETLKFLNELGDIFSAYCFFHFGHAHF